MALKKPYFLISSLVLLVICTACATSEDTKAGSAQPPPTAVKAPEQQFYDHTVKWNGETFSIIAAWYTGDMQNWKALAEANPNVNPNRIQRGMTIRIPLQIVKTRSPMPKEHVDAFHNRTKKQTTRGNQEKEAEPQLFGPKSSPQR